MHRRILRQVCKQLASGDSSRAMTDYTAVQRFAQQDLVADVKDLIAIYAMQEDLASFLLRMVWIGELEEALPEALLFALSASAPKYTRIAAIRAVRVVGSPRDMEEVRAKFFTDSAELNRDLLTELLDGLEATTHTTNWLLKCLAKTETEDLHMVDGLAHAVVAFARRKCQSSSRPRFRSKQSTRDTSAD